MSRPARKAARVKTRVNPSVLAASLLALVLLAVPAAVIANGRPWAASDAETASASVPDPVASVTPTTEPTPEPTPQPTPEAKPKRKAQPVVGSGGKVVRGTTLVLEPSDGALERMLRRKAEALLRGEDGEPVEPAVPVEPVVPVEPLVPGAPVVPSAPVEPVESTTFRVSSFNILGAAHTAPSGNRPEYARGVTRMRWAMSVLRSENVSVAGLQEFEHPQHAAVQQSAPGWDVFPGMTRGLSSLANSIVWRSDVWEFVRGHTIPIPYFNGNPKPMPYVLLRHVGTGREVWFANFHNPASTRGPAAHWRREAVRRESGLADRLAATGRPVILTGDMNDRAEFFCPMTATSQMHAANGGSRGAPCKPPANMRIDWIMGSADVDFSDYAVRDDALVDRTSDHPFIVSSVTIAR
jgi:endonuclease/exonuclease/phosphatase family metal-dependent hydrolase